MNNPYDNELSWNYENIKDNTIYVIGNDFDLSLGLKTSYKDFKSFVFIYDKEGKRIIKFIDKFLKRCNLNKTSIKNWSDFEKYLALLNDVDNLKYDAFTRYTHHLERIKGNTKFNDEKEIRLLENYLNKLKKYINKVILFYLPKWIEHVNTSIVPERLNTKLIIKEGFYYLSFNYTNTLEKAFDIDSSHICHIHSKSDKYILGHNENEIAPFEIDEGKEDGYPVYTIYHKDDKLELHYISSLELEVVNKINKTYLDLYSFISKNSKELINDNINFFNRFDDAKIIVFVGFSFGKEDMIYIEEIFKRINENTKLMFYYHNDKDLEKIKLIKAVTNGKFIIECRNYDDKMINI